MLFICYNVIYNVNIISLKPEEYYIFVQISFKTPQNLAIKWQSQNIKE